MKNLPIIDEKKQKREKDKIEVLPQEFDHHCGYQLALNSYLKHCFQLFFLLLNEKSPKNFENQQKKVENSKQSISTRFRVHTVPRSWSKYTTVGICEINLRKISTIKFKFFVVAVPLTKHGMSSILGGESLILATSGVNTSSQVRYASTHHDMEVLFYLNLYT